MFFLRRPFLRAVGLASGICALGFAFIPLAGVFPAALLLCLGAPASAGALWLGRRRDRVWDGVAAAGLSCSLAAGIVAAGMTFLTLWALERFMQWAVKALTWLTEPLSRYPAF